jgi:hypothetical protein
MEFSTEWTRQLAESLAREVRKRVRDCPDLRAAELEGELREAMWELGARCLEAVLNSLEERYPEEGVPCSCGGRAEYRFRREAKVLSVFGWVSYRRAYYVCPTCHRGQCPVDGKFGLRPGQVSVVLASLLAVLGIQTAFEEASELAEQLLMVKVSENTVRKEAQHFGQLQEEEEEAWQAQSQDFDHLQARRRAISDPPRRLYGSLDGVLVPVDEEWRELKCGCWYEVEPVGSQQGSSSPRARGDAVGDTGTLRAKEITYYCDLAEARALSPLVWATGCQRGGDLAEEIVFVADGAAWIWKLVDHHFPHAVQIVDWYHAAAYLPPIAQAAYGEGSPQAKRWLEAARTNLWKGRVHQVIEACRELEGNPQARAPARRAITYYTHNRKRMEYARLREAGYQIGSGTMESGCKRVGTQRLKRAGARWTERGARYTAKARAAWLSGQWKRLEDLNAQLALAA